MQLLKNFSNVKDWTSNEGKYYLSEMECEDFFGITLADLKDEITAISEVELVRENRVWVDRLIVDKRIGKGFYTGFVDSAFPNQKPIMAFIIYIDLNATDMLDVIHIEVYGFIG